MLGFWENVVLFCSFSPPYVTFALAIICLFQQIFFPLSSLSLSVSQSCAHTQTRHTFEQSIPLLNNTSLLVWVLSLLPALKREGRWDSKELPGAQFAQRFDVIEML